MATTKSDETSGKVGDPAHDARVLDVPEAEVPDRSENDVFIVPGTNIQLPAYPPGHPDDIYRNGAQPAEVRNDAREWAAMRREAELLDDVLAAAHVDPTKADYPDKIHNVDEGVATVTAEVKEVKEK